MTNTTKEYYYCYSASVAHFLKERDIRCITIARSIKDNSVFSMFEQTEELSNALKEYGKLKTAN